MGEQGKEAFNLSLIFSSANLTTAPRAFVDRNGITLILEGDIGAHFWRKNRTYNILSANGQLRVGVG
jgi:hypothetical protein